MTSNYIDMTPTWPHALKMLRVVIENGTDEGKALAWSELERMAELAQLFTKLEQQGQAAQNAIEDELDRMLGKENGQ